MQHVFESCRSRLHHDFGFKNHGRVTAQRVLRAASSLLNESGKWSPDVIASSLAHVDMNAIRGTYNRGRYWDERVAMAQWWSDYLDELRADVSDEPVRKVRARA
ncbi:MAG: hypothetical protein ACJLS3_03165 [Erythrobacter sp.]